MAEAVGAGVLSRGNAGAGASLLVERRREGGLPDGGPHPAVGDAAVAGERGEEGGVRGRRRGRGAETELQGRPREVAPLPGKVQGYGPRRRQRTRLRRFREWTQPSAGGRSRSAAEAGVPGAVEDGDHLLELGDRRISDFAAI